MKIDIQHIQSNFFVDLTCVSTQFCHHRIAMLSIQAISVSVTLLFLSINAKECTITDVRNEKDGTWNFKGCSKINCVAAGLTDGDVVQIATHLEGDANVITLDLSQNHFGDKGAIAIATLLEHKNSKLSHLWLSANKIGCGGITKVAEAIAQNVYLEELHIARNHIHSDGAKAISQALIGNTMLKKLDVSHNAFHYLGTAALAKALEQNKGLTHLNIGFNRIGDIGVRTLANGLRKNKVLHTLNIRSNGIGETGAHMLAQELRRNRHLSTIEMSHNNASPEAMYEVSKLVHRNEDRKKKKKIEMEAASKSEL